MVDQPNVLILMSDEHSYRYMGYRERCDHEPVHTPSLDRLAATGAYFSHAYAPVPLCTPSRMCIHTGRSAENCGAWTNSAILDPSLMTLPGYFAAHGYETCHVGKMHSGGTVQFHGYRHRPYGDFGGKPPSHQPDPIGTSPRDHEVRTAQSGVTTIPESLLQERVVVEESLSFLREHHHRSHDQPWLLTASFSRPHFPLTSPARHFGRYWPRGVKPPNVGREGDSFTHPMTVAMRKGFDLDHIGPEETLRARAAYSGCVDFLDEVIGDFLACLDVSGLLENTIVVYLSDHGEMAGEHGLWWKICWHEGATRVPFMIQLPEHRQGRGTPREIREPVTLTDLFPTLAGLCGLEPPEGVDGMDLSDAVRGREQAIPSERVVSQVLWSRWGAGMEFRVARLGSYKYVTFRNAPELLFDLADDPNEQVNLAPSRSDVLSAAREVALQDFDWDAMEERRIRESEALARRFARRPNQWGPNQFLLPDGRLVEADTVLYDSRVLSAAPRTLFSDWPERGSR